MDRPYVDDRDDGWFSRGRLSVIALLIATGIGVYLCYRLAEPFLPAIAGALAMAVIALPLHRWIEARIRWPSIAAGISVTLVVLFIVLPVTFLGFKLAQEANSGIETLQHRAEEGRWRQMLDQNPRAAEAVAWIEERVNVEEEARSAVSSVASTAGAVLQGGIWVATQMLISLLVLYFLFRDRRRAVEAMHSLLPLSDDETSTLQHRVSDTIYATVFGTLVVAAVQGALGGLMFWLLGIPGSLLWGVVMAVLAVIPVLGAFVIWAPAAIFLAIEGSWGKALMLTAWGTIVVGLIDNLLYPMLVGNKLRMHTVPVFFALVGGLAVFGASGIVLGPAVLAVTLALLEFWKRRTRAGQPAEAAVSTA